MGRFGGRFHGRFDGRFSRPAKLVPWYAASEYAPASGSASIILDFVNNRYRSAGADVALSSLISNAPTLTASGMPATATNIAATGAALSTILGAACTVVMDVTNGPTTAAVMAPVNFGLLGAGNDSPILIGATGSQVKMRNFRFTGATSINSQAVDWTQRHLVSAAWDASGRDACVDGLWGCYSDAGNVYSGWTTIQIGTWSLGSPFGGNIRRMWIFPRRLSAADHRAVTTLRPAPAKGAGSLLFQANQKLVVNSAGSAALNWERTQPWSSLFAFRKSAIPSDSAHSGSDAHVIWTNVAAPGTGYRGWEAFWDASGRIDVRIMSSAFGSGAGTNYLDVRGATNVCDDKWHVGAITNSGSSTAAGVKIYVDGVLETMTTIRDTLTGTLINSPANDFWIGNQVAFESLYMAESALDHFTVYNRELSAAEVAARSTLGTLPGIEANQVLRLPMDEGTGTAVADTSGNAYNGTLTSATQWVT